MAELINKNELLTKIRLNYNNHQNISAGAIKDMIDTTPTTTESEIGAKAIDEFAEKLCDAFSEKYGEVTVNGIKFDVLTLDGATEITLEVAEQLKGE